MGRTETKARWKPGGPAKDIDAYLAGIPRMERAVLEKLRATIRSAAPKAIEVISYGIPSFKHHGYLVGFAAFKAHCSFFPGAYVSAHKKELQSYDLGKGTIHFTPEHPLPAALVKKIVRARVRENEARAGLRK
jgi:uncharacterized protein YdhG (YjbR/CyaY superfamily)